MVVLTEQTRPAAGRARRHRPLTAAGRVQAGGQYALLALLAAFCGIPFLWLLFDSIDAKAGPDLQVPTPSLGNYGRFFGGSDTALLLGNSLLIAGGATVITLAFGMLGGYALSRFRFPGRRPLMFFILLIRVVPSTATIVPLYLLMIRLGLNNSYLGLILVEAAYQLPIAMWLLKGFVDTIPVDLEEAAWTDGSSRWGAIRRIVFPLARPGVGAAALFAFIAVWGDFLTPLVLLQSENMYPLSIGLFRAFAAHDQVDWGLLTATAIVYMVPPAVLYLIVRRFLLRATVTGAVKG